MHNSVSPKRQSTLVKVLRFGFKKALITATKAFLAGQKQILLI